MEAVKKDLCLLKTPKSFFLSTLFSVLKTNSIKIFEIFLKNKPVSNDIYNEVVELNPSLLYGQVQGMFDIGRAAINSQKLLGLCTIVMLTAGGG